MNTEVIRKDWVGNTVQERYRLVEWLGSFGQSGVFLCAMDGYADRKAAIKLFPANVQGSAACAAGWATAAGLAHPHLIRVLDTGRDQIQGTGVLYVVTEYAGEILSDILPDRALTAAEVKEMLGPILDALGHLHENGLVHGRLKPSNIMVVDEQIKLSSENIRGSAARMTPPPVLEIYDAPEKTQGRILPATDLWSLGVTVVEALTRVPPVWNRAAQGDPVVPQGIAEPFAQIARECLRREPENRCTLDEVQACVETGAAIPHRPIKPVKAKPVAVPAARPAAAPAENQVTTPAAKPAAVPKAKPMARRRVAVVGAVAAVLIVLGIILMRPHHATTPAPQTSEDTTSEPAAEPQGTPPQAATPPAPAASPQAQAPASESAPAAPQLTQAAPSEAAAPAAPAPAMPTPAAKAGAGPGAKGAVAQQVMPEIPEKAMQTIHGTVKASIQVNVDARGAVSNAAIDSPGPSRYFANLALEAARSWKFTPAQVNGQGVPSVWVLHFAFRQAGTEVTPTEQSP